MPPGRPHHSRKLSAYLCRGLNGRLVFPLLAQVWSQFLRGCSRARAPGCRVVLIAPDLWQLLLLVRGDPSSVLGPPLR